MDDIVDRLLAHWVAEGVEEAKGVYEDCQRSRNGQQKTLHKVRARIDSQANLGNLIIRTRGRLGLSNRRVVG